MEALFNPSSVGLVGDLGDANSRSHRIFNNLIDYQYPGELMLVSSGTDEVLGYDVHQDIEKVQNSAELLILHVPGSEAVDIIRDIDSGVNPKIVSVFSSSFPNQSEEEIRQELQELKKKKDFRILGPRCTGIFSSHHAFNATAHTTIPDQKEGKIAFVSQRGAYGDLLFSQLENRGYQIGKFVSIGDQVDVSHEDVLKYLQDDPETDVIALFIEELQNGPEFLRVARETSLHKPIVSFYVSQDSDPKRHSIYRAAFEQSGVQLFDNTDDFFDAVTAFAGCSQTFPMGDKMGVVSTSEGLSIAAGNEAKKYNLSFSSNSNSQDSSQGEGHRQLDNVVEVAYSDQEEAFIDNCQNFVSSKDVHGCILLNIGRDHPSLVEELVHQSSSALKPLLAFVSRSEEVESVLDREGVPKFGSPERAVEAFQVLKKYRELLSEQKKKTLPGEEVFSKIHQGRKLLAETSDDRITSVPRDESNEFLQENTDFPVADELITESKKDAMNFGRTVGLPVRLEVYSEDEEVSPELSQRGVDSLDSLKTAYLSLRRRSNKAPILIRKVEGPGIELMIRAVRDETFGIIMEFGLGGMFTEVLQDVSYRLAPIRGSEAKSMISSIDATNLLEGYKQYPPVNKKALKDLLISVSEYMIDNPSIQKLDLNPVVASEEQLRIHEADVHLLKENG